MFKGFRGSQKVFAQEAPVTCSKVFKAFQFLTISELIVVGNDLLNILSGVQNEIVFKAKVVLLSSVITVESYFGVRAKSFKLKEQSILKHFAIKSWIFMS